MSKEAIIAVREAMAARGWRAAFCTIEALRQVEDELAERRVNGLFAASVFEAYVRDMERQPPAVLPKARSICIVAAPVGRTTIVLDTTEGRVEAVIPPTYDSEDIAAEIGGLLCRALALYGSGLSRAFVPVKSLAARTGLGRYGRDNVLRFEGAGSYVRLDAWWTEIDAAGEPWSESGLFERCEGCGACERVCPTGALVAGRFAIDASRCLTFLNERDDPFPPGLDPRAHNAAVGCLRCQEVCPANCGVPGNGEYRRIVLDRAESEALLAGRPLPGSAACEAALRAACMTGSEAALGRNLRALIAARALG